MKQGEAWPRTTEFINDMVTGDSHKSDFGGVMEMESQSKRGGDCVQMTLSRHFFLKIGAGNVAVAGGRHRSMR